MALALSIPTMSSMGECTTSSAFFNEAIRFQDHMWLLSPNVRNRCGSSGEAADVL
jgi:hypothetical protein